MIGQKKRNCNMVNYVNKINREGYIGLRVRKYEWKE